MAKKELKLHAVVSPTETVVVSAYDEDGKAEESVLDEKDRIDLKKLDPIIYDEEQLQYLTAGDKIADAFRTGMEVKKKLLGEE